jgi:HK97 family phage major capsid protein
METLEIKQLLDNAKAEVSKAVKEANEANKSQMEALEAKVNAIKESDKSTEIIKEVERVATELKEIKEKGKNKSENKGLKAYIMENSEVLKSLKSKLKANEKEGLKHFSISVDKATQGASDIGSREFLGEIEAGIERKPVQRTAILDLFRRKAVSTEYLHFWEENVVTRDAKFVIACATSTHTTKKTWQKRTVELAKIRDIVDICIDMLDDYAFVESEIRQLVEESIMLKADYELLLGESAAATDMLSIDSISSEFSASNVLARYDGKFQSPTLGDLTAAMKAQIYTFGKERAWNADTVVMNYNDMITYLHAKDDNNNYLFPNFVFGATDVINGMRIVTSPIVSANTLYVFDSTKGSILDRKMLTVNSYFENKDNAEHELVTFVGVERLQFHVRNINRDAFMKCSDIEAAIVAIKTV